jgi:hypothetical protein
LLQFTQCGTYYGWEHLSLDENSDSAIPGCPGTSFIVNLRTASIQIDELEPPQSPVPTELTDAKTDTARLPEGLSVLVTDDDRVLRKLISRSLKRISPTWKLSESSNGETALMKAQEQSFDLIFMVRQRNSRLFQLF